MKIFVLAAGIAASLVAFALPASATDTTTTFSLQSGALSLTAPVTANLGSASAGGGPIMGQLGAITVSDQRAVLDASWTATVSASDFTTGGATPAETIASTSVDYESGAATATTGTGTFTPAPATTLNGTFQPVFTLSSGVGNNSATWNPSVTVTQPASAVAGTYTGTITHSVA